MTFKTDVCPKSLNPQWNSEWFKFEVRPIFCFILNKIATLFNLTCRYSVCGVFPPRCVCVGGWWGFAGRAVTDHGSGSWHVQCERRHREGVHRHRPAALQWSRHRHLRLVSHLRHHSRCVLIRGPFTYAAFEQNPAMFSTSSVRFCSLYSRTHSGPRASERVRLWIRDSTLNRLAAGSESNIPTKGLISVKCEK